MRADTQYREQLISLLPPGDALAAGPGTTLRALLYGLAAELSRIDVRMDDLTQESLLSLTEELITDFEEEFGIPEPGTELGKTLEDRRRVLSGKLIAVGEQNPDYFFDIAERLGYEIEVEQYQPFFIGYSTVGSTIGKLSILFKWMVWILIADDIKWNISQLIYDITQNKPGQTEVFFEFKGVGFSRGFSNGFEAIQHYDSSWSEMSFDGGFSSGFENNTDYYGVNYVGGFSNGFSIGFDEHVGGGFEKTGFSDGFLKPA
jgi:uncharacterized protein YmfQ (DUF2313 family)